MEQQMIKTGLPNPDSYTLPLFTTDYPDQWRGIRDQFPLCMDRQHSGLETMAQSTAVICGLARDVEPYLGQAISFIEQLGSRFRDFRVVIYENDSVDNTRQILTRWAGDSSRLDILSEIRGDKKWDAVRDVNRTVQMAGYRNKYIEHCMAHYADFDYLIVMDMDIAEFEIQGVQDSMSQNGWDAVTANGLCRRAGKIFYYDSFAFRTYESLEILDERQINLLHFHQNDSFIRVASAFGGLALYRLSSISGSRYYGDDCEHVLFHESMIKNGFDRIYLNPRMINRYPDWELIHNKEGDPDWWRIDLREQLNGDSGVARPES